MKVEIIFEKQDSEKIVKINTFEKKYQFKALKKISKNNNPYVGLFVKNGYKGFLNIHLNSGKIVLDDTSYNLRLIKDNTFELTLDENKNSDYKINKKNYLKNYNYHEDNIKAEIYLRLKENNINCQLEFTIPKGRVDIAIKDYNNNVVGFIEVKKPSNKYEINRRSNIRLDKTNMHNFNLTKQFKKYLETGLPLFISTGYQNIPLAITYAKSLL